MIRRIIGLFFAFTGGIYGLDAMTDQDSIMKKMVVHPLKRGLNRGMYTLGSNLVNWGEEMQHHAHQYDAGDENSDK